jgi:hypothetical protein
MPPAAITGTPTASATCGTRAKVPIWPSPYGGAKVPRWPPASQPWAMTASTPPASSALASCGVVAEAISLMPAALIAATSAGTRQAEMEACHRRAHRQQVLERLAVEDRKRRGRGGRLAGTKLRVPGGQAGLQACGPRRFRHRLGVDEIVQVDRVVGQRAQLVNLAPPFFDRKDGGAERAQAAGIGHCGGERRHRGTTHRRLDNRMLDAEELDEAPVLPHEGVPKAGWKVAGRA